VFASNFFATGVWNTQKQGAVDFTKWDSPVSNPASDAITWMRTVQEATCGYKPNFMAIGAPVFDILRNHPDVIDKIKYTNPGFSGDVTKQLLAQYFGIERVEVGDTVTVTSPKGAATTTKAQLYGKQVLVGYATPRPTLRSPTAGLVIAWDGGTGMGRDARGMAVRRWRNDERRGDAFQCSAHFAMKRVSQECALFAYDVVT